MECTVTLELSELDRLRSIEEKYNTLMRWDTLMIPICVRWRNMWENDITSYHIYNTSKEINNKIILLNEEQTRNIKGLNSIIKNLDNTLIDLELKSQKKCLLF